jgi:hypothetical protein
MTVSPPPPVPPQPTFMSSWEIANIEWDKYNLRDTFYVEKIISDFKGLNSKHLVGNIENNSILQLTPKKFTTEYIAASGVDQSDFNIIEFFDYTKTFKAQIATDVNKNNSFLTRRTDRDTSLLKQLGYLRPNDQASTPVKVVSLLTRGKELVGICYSICTDRSDIDRSLGLRRLICAKKSGVVDVQIWFFPEHPLGYQFYQGKVIFDDKGLYKGLKEGILLIKKNGIYEVVHGNFIGDAVDGNLDNKLYQYSYDAPAAAAAALAAAASPAVNLLKLEGYAAGKIGWNLGKPFPIDMVDITGVTCLNWNFGKVVVNKFIDDDDLSTCDKMYYTTHHDGLDTSHIEGLLKNAALPQIPTISIDERKIDFIKKEDYVDTYFEKAKPIKCKSLKLKCKVATGNETFCIIELLRPTVAGDEMNRVRIYKTYRSGISRKGVKIIKEGLFIGFDNSGKIEFVSFYQVNERQSVTGIKFTDSDANSTAPGQAVSIKQISMNDADEVVKKTEEYRSGEVSQKLTSRCAYFDNATKDSFESSKKAASVSYNLFLSKGGLVDELLKGLDTGAGAGATTVPDLTTIKDELKKEATDMITKVKKVLSSAMTYVSGIQDSESYIPDVGNVFADLDPASLAPIKAGLGSGAPPPSTLSDFDVVTFEIGPDAFTGIYIPTDIFGNASVAGVGSAAAAAVPSIIYFDKHATSYVIKRDDISNLSKSTTVLTPNVGTFVIVGDNGDNGDINTARPGIITMLDSTSPVPLTIKYIHDISNPTTTTEFNYDSATDSELHSAKDSQPGAVITKKIWLCVPKEMIPASSVLILTGASAPPPPSSGAAGGQKFNIGDKVLVVGDGTSSSQPAVVENLLKTPNQVYKVAVYDAANNSYKIKTTLGVDKFYDDIPESNLGPAPPPPPPPSSGAAAVVTFSPGEVVHIDGLPGSSTTLNGRVGVFINTTMSAADANVNVNIDGTYTVYGIPIANLTQVIESGTKITVPIPAPGGLVPVLEVGGIARVSASSSGTYIPPSFLKKKVLLLSKRGSDEFKASLNSGGDAYIDKSGLTPLYSAFDVKYSTNGSVALLAGGGGRSSGRIRGTRKYQKRHRRGNMRRRITRKIKRSRRGGVVHRGGGGRGGKIYRKTRKHVRGGRGGRGGRGHGGHRRTIKKYHRR